MTIDRTSDSESGSIRFVWGAREHLKVFMGCDKQLRAINNGYIKFWRFVNVRQFDNAIAKLQLILRRRVNDSITYNHVDGDKAWRRSFRGSLMKKRRPQERYVGALFEDVALRKSCNSLPDRRATITGIVDAKFRPTIRNCV
jgi:hypothetical protein